MFIYLKKKTKVRQQVAVPHLLAGFLCNSFYVFKEKGEITKISEYSVMNCKLYLQNETLNTHTTYRDKIFLTVLTHLLRLCCNDSPVSYA